LSSRTCYFVLMREIPKVWHALVLWTLWCQMAIDPCSRPHLVRKGLTLLGLCILGLDWIMDHKGSEYIWMKFWMNLLVHNWDSSPWDGTKFKIMNFV
jgi:hypothetical protein